MSDETIKIENTFSKYYHEANNLSIRSQKKYVYAFKSSLISLVISSFLGCLTVLIDKKSVLISLNILCMISILISLVATIIVHKSKLQKLWYDGRAVAESLKTMSWKYFCDVISINPDDIDGQLSLFIQDTNKILISHPQVYLKITKNAGLNTKFTTEAMQNIKTWDWQQKKDVYIQQRVLEQAQWYQEKADFNAKRKIVWYFGIIISLIFALVCLSLVLINTELTSDMVGFFTTISTSIISWIQVKRFQELQEAYSTTAIELILIYQDGEGITNRIQFIQYVKDAEKAISREHTLWIARRDHHKLQEHIN